MTHEPSPNQAHTAAARTLCLLGALLLLALALLSPAPAGAANAIQCWKVVFSQPCVSLIVGDVEAALPTAGVPEGAAAWAKDTDQLVCFDGAAWVPCSAGGGGGGGGLEATDLDTSAKLRAIVGDELGSGALLFGLDASMADGLSCSASQVVRRNAADTAFECATITPGTGTVTSVGLSAPSIFSVSGSPVTTTGTLALSLATQTANTLLAGPTTGSAAAPAFRALVEADVSAVSAPWSQHSPFKPLASCGGGSGAVCDEFTSGTSLTFTCNGGTITQSTSRGRYRMVKAMSGSSADMAMCSTPAPAGSWTATTYVSPVFPRSSAQCGIAVIRAGTQSTPTAISVCGVYQNNTGGTDFSDYHNTYTSYTATPVGVGSKRALGLTSYPYWLQARYDASADTLSCWRSPDADDWVANGTTSATVGAVQNETSITSDPPFIGFAIDDAATGSTVDMSCSWEMLRVRTDANRNNASD